MSAVPGPPKVTRCTSKPAAFRMFSRTPSAPASAGVTEGQRTRSRVMETASFIARLNTPNRRRASCVRHRLGLGLLVPAGPRIDRRQRVGAEAVVALGASEAIHLDKTPHAEYERGKSENHRGPIAQPVTDPGAELAVETGQREEC